MSDYEESSQNRMDADGELITPDNVEQLLKVITEDKPVQVVNTDG